MKRAVRIAGIAKRATPHTLRHSYATHSYEQGCDIRSIQNVLGHVHLETTTIYVRVARQSDEDALTSPLDRLHGKRQPQSSLSPRPRESVGQMRMHFKAEPEGSGGRKARVTLAISNDPRPVYLTGILAKEVRPGWVTLEIPPLEQWEEPLLWLTATLRERVCEPEFFELLQREIPRRLLN